MLRIKNAGFIILLLVSFIFSGTLITIAEVELPFELNLPLTPENEKPELAEMVKMQLKDTIGLGQGMEEMPEDMLDLEVASYHIAGNKSSLLNDLDMPAEMSMTETKQDAGEMMLELVDNLGFSFAEQWGEDWIDRAEMAAENSYGIEVITRTYNYQSSPFETFTVNLTAPYIDLKSLEIQEGIGVSIIHSTINMASFMLDDEEEE